MELRTLADVSLAGKRVLYRVGYDVPLRKNGRSLVVAEDTRIRETLPTLQKLREGGAAVVLLSWLGRPKGTVVEDLRMVPVAQRLARLGRFPVETAPDCIGRDVASRIAALKPGNVLMLENVRFHPEEDDHRPDFAQKLVAPCDLVVMDAFSQAHRDVASISGILRFRPAIAGLLLEREVRELSAVLERPARPLVAVIGGAKISTKLGLIAALLPKVDYLCLGGALANTILKAKGIAVGRSLVEEDMLETLRGVELTSPKLKIPVDVTVGGAKSADTPRRTVAVGNVLDDDLILDIGPDTVNLFSRVIEKAKTVIWNGPMGVYELAPFTAGTRGVARSIASSKAKAVAGGGETLDAIAALRFQKKFHFLSTGGGAMLEFLEGKKLPGIQPLVKTTR